MKICSRKVKIVEFIVDETLIKVGSEYIWLWVEIDTKNNEILVLTVSKEKNMFVAEQYLLVLVKVSGKHSVSTDGGGAWYPIAGKFLKLKHHIHSPLVKKRKA